MDSYPHALLKGANLINQTCIREIEKAEAEDKAQPTMSHILKTLLRKGNRTHRLG